MVSSLMPSVVNFLFVHVYEYYLLALYLSICIFMLALFYKKEKANHLNEFKSV